MTTRKEFFQGVAAAVAAVRSSQAAPAAMSLQEVPSGKLYALEFPFYLSQDHLAQVKAALVPYEERFDCAFLVLSGGVMLRDPAAPVVMGEQQIARLADELARRVRWEETK